MSKTSRAIFLLDFAAVLAFFGYIIILSMILFDLFAHHILTPSSILFALGVGYILADFASGFVHFLGDTFGSEYTPILGKAFIFPFREHHVDPEAITRHGFIETNGHNCLVSLPVMVILAHGVALYTASPMVAFWFVVAYALVIGVFMTNQFHKWAHMKCPPVVIAWLQKTRLILSPKHHQIHHTSPFTRYYCITTGWLNLFLDVTNFFPLSKAVIRRIPFMLRPAEEYAKIRK
jgi:ubiquitin-conjugating enzyme E2 variant